MEKPIKSFHLSRNELIFLGLIYFVSLFWRLWPKLLIDPHLLTMNADVWERLAMAQYFLEHGHLPTYCLRYIAYGNVPFWYPPLSPIGLAILAKISSLDLPTVCSRIMPFLEALTPVSLYFLSRWLFGRYVGYISTTILAITPSFIYWTGITTPTSLTLFLLPIYIILLLIKEEKEVFSIRQRLIWITITGGLLSTNFLTHLTYFFAVTILIFIALIIFIKSGFQGKKILDFIAAILFSQLITAFWWAPHNLYWWWIFSLTTSSSSYETPIVQLKNYGITAGVIGLIACLLYLWKILKKSHPGNRYDWLPLVWIILPFIETQNENILKIIHRLDLTWYTILKPLEGYRFYGFLAQPLALIIGWVIAKYLLVRVKHVRRISSIIVLILSLILTIDLQYVYGIFGRFQNAGITLPEYKAAGWFGKNTSGDDRIIVDYYRSQVFAGVCAGKTLLGGLFPLKNTKLPYISVPAVVQDDICTIYTTVNPETANNLMRKYGSNCIFISPTLISVGYLGTPRCPGFGIPAELKKFENRQYFIEFYNDDQGIRIMKINEGADKFKNKVTP